MSPGTSAPIDLKQIKQDVQSDRQEIRVRAMQSLLLAAQKNPAGLGAAALPIFQQSMRTETDPSTAIYAVRGIEVLAPEEGMAAWLALLTHPNAVMIERAATAIRNPQLAPILMELAERRLEIPVRVAAIRTLGRLKDSFTLPVLLKSLENPELRPHAIEALGDFGDASAIPHLERFLQDTTEAWEEDNHGPMLRVGDLAGTAITRLRAAPSRPAVLAGVAPAQHSPPQHAPPPIPASRPKVVYAAFIPFIAAVFELPWLAAIVIGQIMRTGKFDPTQQESHWITFLAMTPPAIGLAAGIFVLIRGGVNRVVDWIFLLIGLAACGLCLFGFAWDPLH